MNDYRRNRDRRPARAAATKNPARRLLVVCEGTVTEPAYLRGFERHIRNATLVIDMPDDAHGAVPLTLVNRAHDLKRQAEKHARREKDAFLAYDEVWCVFDIDEHPHINEAFQLAAANSIKLAVSNPCFELWLLLHFRESPGAWDRRDLQRMVGEFIVGYAKRLDFEAFKLQVGDVTRRARRLNQDADNEGEPGRNPTTGVYRLVDSIARTD